MIMNSYNPIDQSWLFRLLFLGKRMLMVFAIMMLIKKSFLLQLLLLKELLLFDRIFPAGTYKHHQYCDKNKHKNVSIPISRYETQIIFLPFDSFLLYLGLKILSRLTVKYCFDFLLISFDISQYHLIKITKDGFYLS